MPADYRSNTKDNWRRWQWNRICSNFNNNVRTRSVVYLCGPTPEDMNIAVEKGFARRNLVAVDVDAACITSTRRQGGLAVQADLIQVLNQWNDKPIDVIVADFCCGLSDSVEKTMHCLSFLPHVIRDGETIVSCNMQRGRDPHSNHLRSHLDKLPACVLRELPAVRLHRGQQLMLSLIANTMVFLWNQAVDVPESFAIELMRFMNPQFRTYRHRKVLMDTVIFNPYVLATNRLPAIARSARTTRRLAALKAVRNRGRR